LQLREGGVSSADGATVSLTKAPNRAVIISALGVTQIFAWGTSYYLPAVLAVPIVADTGWSLTWVVGGLSLGLLTAGVASPFVGRTIAQRGGRPVLAVSAGLLATGLLTLALAHSLPVFLLAWLMMGLGMGAGLYDPAFATLGRLYGEGGRSAITTLPCSAALPARFVGRCRRFSTRILDGAAHVSSMPPCKSPSRCRSICSCFHAKRSAR
jgi:MFS family permease